MSSWLGRSRITFTHAENSLTVQQGEKKLSFAELCKRSTPPCWLNPLLFNGDLQTMWTAVDKADTPVFYKRHIFEAEISDFEGSFAVDFAVPPYDDKRDPSLPNRTAYYSPEEFSALGGDDETPMIIVLHGLSGGSYEIYLRAVLKPLLDAGWEACVVNGRGCAMSKITTGILYNARATWDVRQTVKWVRERWPKRPLFGMGFSLGANIITNYVGEEGASCLLKAAIIFSNPWNLDVSNKALERTWLGREIYLKTMGSNMKNLIALHREKLSEITRIDFDKVSKVKTLTEFDRYVQGPTWGYPTEGAYYRDASSVDVLQAIRIPFFAISAEDDPIVHAEAIPFEEFKQNPYTVLCTTSMGGHLSWFEIGGTRWFAKPAVQFLTKMAETDLEIIAPLWPNPSSHSRSIAEGAPPFFPTRRKMRLVMDN